MAKETDHGQYRTFEGLVDEIPRYESFFTVSEHRRRDNQLAESHDHVAFNVVGESSEENEIWSLTVGEGSQTALLFAAPHPNEPIGSMTIDFLAHQLAADDDLRDSLDYTFVFVKIADIDGTLLNQGWFDGPFTISNYAQNFYRPAGYEQVEWTFPMDYEGYEFDSPTPETEILMNLIDDHEPEFIYSLHNAGFGGCYYYISDELTEIFDDLRQVSREQDVPLDLGEPETPWMEEFDDAVFKMPSATQRFDYLAENSKKDPHEILQNGAGSFDYAREQNSDVVELVTELPYFYDPKIESDDKVGRSRREVVLDGADRSEELVEFLSEQFDRVADDLPEGRLKNAIEETIEQSPQRITAKRQWAEDNEGLKTTATVAQEMDELTIRTFYQMLYFGTFMRLLDRTTMVAEESEVDLEELHAVKETIERRFNEINGSLLKNLDYRTIPIRNLIAIQAQAGMITLDFLQETNYFE